MHRRNFSSEYRGEQKGWKTEGKASTACWQKGCDWDPWFSHLGSLCPVSLQEGPCLALHRTNVSFLIVLLQNSCWMSSWVSWCKIASLQKSLTQSEVLYLALKYFFHFITTLYFTGVEIIAQCFAMLWRAFYFFFHSLLIFLVFFPTFFIPLRDRLGLQQRQCVIFFFYMLLKSLHRLHSLPPSLSSALLSHSVNN